MNSPVGVDSPPVFIVSTGRSGSMMIARTLGVHPGIYALHEPYPRLNTEGFAKWSNPAKTSELTARVERKRRWLLEQTSHNGYLYVESSHFCSFFIPELFDLFGAKFVHLHREGGDFVRSAIRRKWYRKEGVGGRIRTRLRRRFLVDIGQPFVDHWLLPPSRYTTVFEKVTWLWVEVNSIILKAFEQLPTENTFSISLNSWTRNDLCGLISFLGESTDEDILDKMFRMAEKRPNQSVSVGCPSDCALRKNEELVFKELAGDMMRHLGYWEPVD
jgi:hypothetical protein